MNRPSFKFLETKWMFDCFSCASMWHVFRTRIEVITSRNVINKFGKSHQVWFLPTCNFLNIICLNSVLSKLVSYISCLHFQCTQPCRMTMQLRPHSRCAASHLSVLMGEGWCMTSDFLVGFHGLAKFGSAPSFVQVWINLTLSFICFCLITLLTGNISVIPDW